MDSRIVHRAALVLALIGAAVALNAQASDDEVATEASARVAPVDRWRDDPQVRLDAMDLAIEDFKWIARPVVIFADSEADPAFQRQIELLDARAKDLADRDVVVITDTDPSEFSSLRRKLRPRGFMLALIGKDGGIKLRKPFPWDVREISRSIDKMPVRKQEIRERRDLGQ